MKTTYVRLNLNTGKVFLVSILFLTLLSMLTFGQTFDDKICSPYFQVTTSDTTLNVLPLSGTRVNAVISGTIANVTVKQTYFNVGTKKLDATYVFPLSTKAAIHFMQMTIGHRIVLAKIEEKAKAQAMYDSAKQNGQTASLLEQQRPNVFQMNLTNILPGDTIEIEIHYTELLVPKSGQYEFVFPTVVGPRYVSPTYSNPSEIWTSTAYFQNGGISNYAFNLSVSLNAGMKIQELISPSHDSLHIIYTTPKKAICTYNSANIIGENKDIIIQYKLAGDELQSGLLLYKGENNDENFFLAMIQPPKVIKPEEMPPHEYIFIVDVSGSMWGYPLDISKQLMENVINDLNSYDKFNILFFDTKQYLLYTNSILATPQNKVDAINNIYKDYGGGGTEVLVAVNMALAITKTEGYARSYVIATDGFVDVEKQTFDAIKGSLGDASFYALGIGPSVNRYFIEGVAAAGNTEPMVATSEIQAESVSQEFKNYIQSAVLSNVTISYTNFNAYDVEPTKLPCVYAFRPVVIFGKWAGEAKGNITITGTNGTKQYSAVLPIEGNDEGNANEALKYLWARKRIELLSDYGPYKTTDSLKNVITQLGLKYHLVTAYTSFIAIDSVIRAEGDTVTTIPTGLPGEPGTKIDTNTYWNTIGNIYTGIEEHTKTFKTTNSGISLMSQNYPNPFNTLTTIKINIGKIDSEKDKFIKIYDAFGRIITTIDITNYTEGEHEFTFDINNYDIQMPSGIYYARLIMNNQNINVIKITRFE